MSELLEDHLFNQSTEPLILIKPDSPYFTIVKYNAAFEAVSRTAEMDITGKSVTEIYKWNSKNEDSALLIHDMLNEAITKKETVHLPAVQYDLTDEKGNIIQPSWWQAIYEPIFSADGEVEFILCTTRNITDKMPGKKNRKKKA